MSSAPVEVAAVILAAGYSSRMGFFKPLASLNGMTALERVIRSMYEAGIFEVLVVSGFGCDSITPLVKRLGAKRVHNPRFAEGMFTSVQAGAAALPHRTEAFFLLPVDIPTVRPSTLRLLARSAAYDTVFHPVFRNLRGHPPLIGASLIPQILKFHGEGGLRAFWETRGSRAENISVADEGILLDMDTPDDFELLWRRSVTLSFPSRQERKALFEIAGTPDQVCRHCEATASVCLALGGALKKRGIRISLPLLRGAALLHDICKHLPDHVEAGDLFLRLNGFPRIADIVSNHKDLSEKFGVEAEILHLADKLVAGVETVTLDKRKKTMKARYASDSNAWSAIRRRYAEARRTIRRVERITGYPLSVLLQKIGRSL